MMAAITGFGLLTPHGDTLDAMQQTVQAGNAGPARIANFEPTRYLNVRGMRVYSRSTQLAICAGQRALAAAGLWDTRLPTEELGLVMASTFGHLDTLVEYDGSLARVGPRHTNPALMPLAISSAPCAATALSLTARACAVTLAGGAPAALDALALAARMLRDGRASTMLVVAARSPVLFDPCPETAVALVLEGEHGARARGARVHARLRGHSSGLALVPQTAIAALDDTWARALQLAEVQAMQAPCTDLDLASEVDALTGILQTLNSATSLVSMRAMAASGMCSVVVLEPERPSR